MMTTQKIAKELCKSEGLKEQVNIAQMNEIVSKIPELLAANPKKILEYLRYFLKDVSFENGMNITFTERTWETKLDEINVNIHYLE